jgi:hypothetical protein
MVAVRDEVVSIARTPITAFGIAASVTSVTLTFRSPVISPKRKRAPTHSGRTDTSSYGQASRHTDCSLGGAEQHFFGVIGAVAAVGDFLALNAERCPRRCRQSLGADVLLAMQAADCLACRPGETHACGRCTAPGERWAQFRRPRPKEPFPGMGGGTFPDKLCDQVRCKGQELRVFEESLFTIHA